MLFIRTAKAMVISETTIAMLVLALLLLSTSTEVIGAERIPDSELASLYGGCWFYNPYCGRYGSSCPQFVEPDCEPLDLCRFCIPTVGQKCFGARSYWPDFDGCKDGTKACENAGWTPVVTPWGYCGIGVCNENYDPTQDYPDCNSVQYNWCDD